MTLTLRNAIGVVMAVVAPTVVLQLPGCTQPEPATTGAIAGEPTEAPLSPTVTVAPAPAATPTPVAATSPTPTPEPPANATSERPPVAADTPIPEPTVPSTPTPGPAPTPKPTLVPMPAPTLSPTPTPAPTATPVPLGPYGSIQTGPEVVGMEAFDRLVPELMHRYNLPGGALAVVKDGRLVFARGYGLADIQNQEPVQPDSLFRIASLSKQITAVAALKLVEDGKLDLDERAFEILSDFKGPEGASRDPRIDQITVRHLLHHAGGWDKEVAGFDPGWIPARIARETGAAKPVSCSDVIHFMLRQPLDFDPGTRYAYANFGYCVLGRIIEKKADQGYETYITERVLVPAGIKRMQVGGSLLNDRAEGEVRYYYHDVHRRVRSVFPDGPERVPWPYGGYYLRGKDSSGGWIASAVDLVRLVSALDGSRPPSLLLPETVDLMLSRHDPPLRNTSWYYAMGWTVRPVGGSLRWLHGGSLPGAASQIRRTHDGVTWALLFNSKAEQHSDFQSDRVRLMRDAIDSITTWPSHDLFPLFGYE